jgi:hypothetical protein
MCGTANNRTISRTTGGASIVGVIFLTNYTVLGHPSHLRNLHISHDLPLTSLVDRERGVYIVRGYENGRDLVWFDWDSGSHDLDRCLYRTDCSFGHLRNRSPLLISLSVVLSYLVFFLRRLAFIGRICD